MYPDRRSVSTGLAALLAAAPSPGWAGVRRLAAGDAIQAAVSHALREAPDIAGYGVAVYSREGVYAQGFGVADVELGLQADADTAWYIASSTKSFTAMAMASLAARSRLDLDAPIDGLAAGAPFPPEAEAGRVRVRDLLTHTSGLSNDPISFRVAYSGQHDPELLWRLLALTKPNAEAPLGRYRYTNDGYNILTVLTDRMLGMRWQDLLQREIFDRAGMRHTTAYMSRAKRSGWRLARGYASALPEGRQPIALRKVDATMQSAGGLIMSANDALRWLELLLNDGRVGGRQAIPAEAVRRTRDLRVETGDTREEYAAGQYSLGWNIGKRRSDEIFFHFGGFPGFRTHVSFIPSRGMGVVVFSNDGPVGAELTTPIAELAYGLMLGEPDAATVFDAAVADMKVQREAMTARVKADRDRRAARTWTLSQPNAAYLGVYSSPSFGEMVVTEERGKLFVIIGELKSVAEPFTAPESLRVELIPYSGSVITFEMAEDGRPRALSWDGDRYARIS